MSDEEKTETIRCPSCQDIFIGRSDWEAHRVPCLADRAEAAESRVAELEKGLGIIASRCGHPDPAEGCRLVLAESRRLLSNSDPHHALAERDKRTVELVSHFVQGWLEASTAMWTEPPIKLESLPEGIRREALDFPAKAAEQGEGA